MADRLADLVDPGAGHTDLADRAGMDVLDRVLDVSHGPAARARLDDPIVFASGLNHPPPFDDVVADRLLDVNILARLAAEHGQSAYQWSGVATTMASIDLSSSSLR